MKHPTAQIAMALTIRADRVKLPAIHAIPTRISQHGVTVPLRFITGRSLFLWAKTAAGHVTDTTSAAEQAPYRAVPATLITRMQKASAIQERLIFTGKISAWPGVTAAQHAMGPILREAGAVRHVTAAIPIRTPQDY